MVGSANFHFHKSRSTVLNFYTTMSHGLSRVNSSSFGYTSRLFQRVQRMKKQRGSPWVAVAWDDYVQGASFLELQGQQPERET